MLIEGREARCSAAVLVLGRLEVAAVCDRPSADGWPDAWPSDGSDCDIGRPRRLAPCGEWLVLTDVLLAVISCERDGIEAIVPGRDVPTEGVGSRRPA